MRRDDDDDERARRPGGRSGRRFRRGAPPSDRPGRVGRRRRDGTMPRDPVRRGRRPSDQDRRGARAQGPGSSRASSARRRRRPSPRHASRAGVGRVAAPAGRRRPSARRGRPRAPPRGRLVGRPPAGPRSGSPTGPGSSGASPAISATSRRSARAAAGLATQRKPPRWTSAMIVMVVIDRMSGPMPEPVGDLRVVRVERGQDHVHVQEVDDRQRDIGDAPADRHRREDRAQREERVQVALVDTRRQHEERHAPARDRPMRIVSRSGRRATSQDDDRDRHEQQRRADHDRRDRPEHEADVGRVRPVDVADPEAVRGEAVAVLGHQRPRVVGVDRQVRVAAGRRCDLARRGRGSSCRTAATAARPSRARRPPWSRCGSGHARGRPRHGAGPADAPLAASRAASGWVRSPGRRTGSAGSRPPRRSAPGCPAAA